MHGEARVIVMESGQLFPSYADIDDRWHLTLDAPRKLSRFTK